jgi:hypothetical protein
MVETTQQSINNTGLFLLTCLHRRNKLQFRAHVKDECKASECSLMCDDFWRLGYQRVIIDPSVRQVSGPVWVGLERLPHKITAAHLLGMCQHLTALIMFVALMTQLAEQIKALSQLSMLAPGASNKVMFMSWCVQTYVPWDPTLYYDNLLGHAIPMRPWSDLVASHMAKGWMKPPIQQPDPDSSNPSAGLTTVTNTTVANATRTPASDGGAAAPQPQATGDSATLTGSNSTGQSVSPATRRHRRALHSWWSDLWGLDTQQGNATAGGDRSKAGQQEGEDGDAVAGFWQDIRPPQNEVCCNKQDNADWVDFGKCSPVVSAPSWVGFAEGVSHVQHAFVHIQIHSKRMC